MTGLPLTCIVLLGLMCQAPGLLARPHVLASRCRRRPGYTDGRNLIDPAVQPSRQFDDTWFCAGSCAIGIVFAADI